MFSFLDKLFGYNEPVKPKYIPIGKMAEVKAMQHMVDDIVNAATRLDKAWHLGQIDDCLTSLNYFTNRLSIVMAAKNKIQ